jgi:hypothetical protein
MDFFKKATTIQIKSELYNLDFGLLFKTIQ